MKKKLLTFILCSCLIIPAIFCLSACSIFGDPAFVNKGEWEGAFAYNNKVIIILPNPKIGDNNGK